MVKVKTECETFDIKNTVYPYTKNAFKGRTFESSLYAIVRYIQVDTFSLSYRKLLLQIYKPDNAFCLAYVLVDIRYHSEDISIYNL